MATDVVGFLADNEAVTIAAYVEDLEQRIEAVLTDLAQELNDVVEFTETALANQVLRSVQSAMNQRRQFFNVEYRREKETAVSFQDAALLDTLDRDLEDEVDDQKSVRQICSRDCFHIKSTHLVVSFFVPLLSSFWHTIV